ncbi:MAG: FUSC family protein [Candidatus Nanopelagicales bacterium]
MHDPGHLLFRKALRVAIVMPLAYLFAMYVLRIPDGVVFTVFGTFALLAFSDFGGPMTDRAKAYIITGLAGMVAIGLGTVAALNPWVAVAGTFVIGGALTFAGVLRGYVTAATMSVLLPFVIAVTAGPSLDQLPQRLLGFAVATLFATAAALLMWPSHIRSVLRQCVAETMDASANVVRAMWPGADAGPNAIDLPTRQRELTEAHHRMREQYDGRPMRPGGATAQDRALMQCVDELSRLRIMLRWDPDSNNNPLPGDVALAHAAADALTQSAAAIGRGGPPPESAPLDAQREAHRVELEEWAEANIDAGSSQVIRPTLDAGFQLRLTAVISELLARNTRVAVGARAEPTAFTTFGTATPDGERSAWQILRSHMTLKSPWLRNSLRSGLALAMAVAVVEITGVGHGFWVVLGTLTALRVDVLGTGKTALQAILGTVGGFVVGTAIIVVFGENPTALWIMLPIAIFLSSYTPGAISLAVGQGSFTVFVIIFYGIIAGPDITTGETRVLDVGIGLAISLVVSALMWPRGVKAKMDESLTNAVHASSAYLVAAYERLVYGPDSDQAVLAASTKAKAAVAGAYETFDLTIAQGRTQKSVGATWSFVANAAGHITASADLVAYLATIGRVPTACPDSGTLLLACSHEVEASANSAVDTMAGTFTSKDTQDFCNTQAFTPETFTKESVDGLSETFSQLEARVDACLDYWQTKPAALAGMALGPQALALVWSEEWLIHLMWVSAQIRNAAESTHRSNESVDSGR